MKLIKTIGWATLVAGILTVGQSSLLAQDAASNKPAAAPGGPGQHGHAGLDAIVQQLGLTDEQKPKFKAVMEDTMQKMRALRTDTSVAQEEKRAKAKEIRDAADAKLKEILTPEQLAKWQKQGTRPHGAGGKPGAGAAQPAAPAAPPQP